MYIILYVGDLHIVPSSIRKLDEITEVLSSKFEIVNLGVPKLFLGINKMESERRKTYTQPKGIHKNNI